MSGGCPCPACLPQATKAKNKPKSLRVVTPVNKGSRNSFKSIKGITGNHYRSDLTTAALAKYSSLQR